MHVRSEDKKQSPEVSLRLHYVHVLSECVASDQTSRDMICTSTDNCPSSHAHLRGVTHLAMAGTTAESTRRSESYRDKFGNVFPDLVKELAKDKSNPEIADSIEHLKKVLCPRQG